MASCTRVKGLTQAYIDGELNHADRVIVELHVSECGACAAEFRERQRLSALMFEALAEQRLGRNLRQSVLENLPEIQPVARDIQEYNWRLKHDRGKWRNVAAYLPAVAVVFLVLIGLILSSYWPRELISLDTIGLITQVQGSVALGSSQDLAKADLRDPLRWGDQISTQPDGAVALQLIGSSEVKMGGSGSMRVVNSRHLWLDAGAIWLDVSPNGRLFKVSTPSGDVTVFGTVFSVAVQGGDTVVTVEHGEVHVSHGEEFAMLELGQQARMMKDGGIEKTAVDAPTLHAWAKAIPVDSGATQLFAARLKNKLPPHNEPKARPYTWELHLAGTNAKSIQGMVLNWQPDNIASGHCSYDLYVTDERNTPLFKTRVDGDIFNHPDRTSYEITLPDGRIDGVRWVLIRLIPDYGTGQVEISNFTILIET